MGRENLSLAEERVLRPVPWSSPLTPLLPDSGSQPMEFLCGVVRGLGNRGGLGFVSWWDCHSPLSDPSSLQDLRIQDLGAGLSAGLPSSTPHPSCRHRVLGYEHILAFGIPTGLEMKSGFDIISCCVP